MKRSTWMVAIGLVLFLLGATNTLLGSRSSADFGDGLDESQVEVSQPGVNSAAVAEAAMPTPRGTDSGTNQPENSFNIPAEISPTAQPADPNQNSEALIPVTGAVYIPDRIRIPAIQLDAPIVEAQSRLVKVDGQFFQQWLAPDEQAVGWHTSSATLGLPGNTVLNGHHNVWGEVFGRLIDLNEGDYIIVSSGQTNFVYLITNKMILPEKNVSLEIREKNAQWLQPSTDERLTLVTCWPKTNNTHRLIIVAKPVTQGEDLTQVN